MKEEIVAGLGNAIEHGSSLEEAKNSFTNAGYNRYEVDAAAKIVSSGGGASKIISNYDERVEDEIPRETEIKKNDADKKWLLIILIAVALFVLLGAVGYLIYVLLK